MRSFGVIWKGLRIVFHPLDHGMYIERPKCGGGGVIVAVQQSEQLNKKEEVAQPHSVLTAAIRLF